MYNPLSVVWWEYDSKRKEYKLKGHTEEMTALLLPDGKVHIIDSKCVTLYIEADLGILQSIAFKLMSDRGKES